MANKKQKKLKKDLSTVKGQLTKTEKKLAKADDRAERWKKEAKAHKKSAAKAGTRADLLAEQLDEASKALKSTPSEAEVEAASADEPGPAGQTPDGAGTPDESWSVVQLRAEARARGLTGMSRASKADLIDALR
jgi:chromosome segregation ATPase